MPTISHWCWYALDFAMNVPLTIGWGLVWSSRVVFLHFRSRALPSENNNAFHDIYVANVTVRETSATLRLHDFPSRSDVEWSRSLAHNKLTPESLPVDLFLGVPRLEVL